MAILAGSYQNLSVPFSCIVLHRLYTTCGLRSDYNNLPVVVFTAVVFAAVDRSMTPVINTYCIPTLVLFSHGGGC
jgi:hypothetical protein